MAKEAISPLASPVSRALVYVCERCGKRTGGSKATSRELASQVKRKSKQRWGKGEVRVALTSCIDACPDSAISVSVLPLRGEQPPLLIEADAHDLDGASDALLGLLRKITDA
jgi:predicted metal-binding protein